MPDGGILCAREGPITIAHRGDSGNYPENTLLAFQKAVEGGADALEFDVRLSKDGAPVVIHDPSIDRTTDGSGSVGDWNLRELRRFDAGRGERIPALVEVLDLFRELPLLIEMKDVAASDTVIGVLSDQRAGERVLVGAFEHAALVPFRKASIRTTASRRETAVWWGTSRIGLSPPRLNFEAFSVPEWSWQGRIHVVDRRFLGRAKRRDVPVHVWTVDAVDQATRLWSAGVTGVITNRPAELAEALRRTAVGGWTEENRKEL